MVKEKKKMMISVKELQNLSKNNIITMIKIKVDFGNLKILKKE
jgi:hypothetical protein